MNQEHSALLTALYRNEQAPFAVLLLGKLQRLFLLKLALDDRAPYLAVNDALTPWWPDGTRPLSEIYWREVAKCWLAYERVPESETESMRAQQQLLDCAYLQLRVLERFEKLKSPSRPALPNDLNSYGLPNFITFVESAFEQLPEHKRRAVSEWNAEFAAAPANRWPEAGAKLDALLAYVTTK